MKGLQGRVSSGLALVLGLLLSACSGSSSSTSRTPSSFAVEYFDDEATPKRVGYSYVAPINTNSSGVRFADASTIGNIDPDFNSGAAYDFVSRSGASLSAVGKYWTFDYWADGAASDAKMVDLHQVTESCKVYAHFKEADYSFQVWYYNADSIKDEEKSQTHLTWGSQPTYPTTYVSDQQPDYSGKTIVARGDWGYDYVNPDDPSSSHPNFAVKDDTDKKTIPAVWTFASGETRPDTVPAAGTLFAVTAKNDALSLNPTYPISLSDGSKWIACGSLASKAVISLDANYLRARHSFIVSFYTADPDNGGTLATTDTLSVPFQDVLASFTADGTTVSATYGTKTVSFASTVKNWTSRFVHCAAVPQYSGKPVDSALRINADAVYFPIA
jgi:hypothetical protein